MAYIYLISSVLLSASSGLLGTLFNKKNTERKNTSELYTMFLTLAVFLFWLILFLSEGCKANWGVVLFAIGFAACYIINNLTFMQSLKMGSLVFTSLISQLSLVGVSVWGFFFWNEIFKWYIAISFILVASSIFLCLYEKKSLKKQKISFKWIVYVLFMFISGAGCSIIQKTQQMKYEGNYGNFLMMIATGLSFLFCLCLYLKNDKTDSKMMIKTSWYIPVLAGIFNGMLNLFAIFMATSELSSSLIYPTIGVGSLMVTTLFSAFIFKEKMKWWQWIGVALGAVAVCILSL